MGLDMFVRKRRQPLPTPVDFDTHTTDEQLFYWRKHPDLHGWFNSLYVYKGGTDPEFNCNTVEITLEDLDELELDIKGDLLPKTSGCFFGASCPEDKADDLEFIELARQAIADGYYLYYLSWW